MVVVDSSALIPFARIGELDLIRYSFDEIHTTEHVRREVLTEGKPGVSALRTFLDSATIHPAPDGIEEVANLEGITRADASVIGVADQRSDVLLANDVGLIEVARTRGLECWWVTTVLLAATRTGRLSATESTDLLYELVDHGMNLHPKVYARVQRALEDLGE